MNDKFTICCSDDYADKYDEVIFAGEQYTIVISKSRNSDGSYCLNLYPFLVSNYKIIHFIKVFCIRTLILINYIK